MILTHIYVRLFTDRRPCDHQYYGTTFFNVPHKATIAWVQVWRM